MQFPNSLQVAKLTPMNLTMPISGSGWKWAAWLMS
jgi:hypothetical protein